MVKLVNVSISGKESMFLLMLYILSLTFARVHAYIACVERLYNRFTVMGFITVVEVVISEPALYR